MSSAPKVRHPFFARGYHRVRESVDARGAAAHRDELLAGISGRVIEVGAGDGGNFARYPGTVAEVLAVEPEPRLRALAVEAARAAPVSVEVADGVAESLPAPDGSFDVAVVSLVLCSVVDPAAAIAELRRVLRPGGEVRFYEHVLSNEPRLARWQRRGAPLQRLFAGGCNPDRDTVAALQRGGFEIEAVRRFAFKAVPLGFLSQPHVIGKARRPR